jgi:hypothetical protein
MRRYPALAFLALAAFLATLLPSALRVPLSGPSASAEIAPVPGKSNDSNGNLSALDASSTQGLGYGLGSGGTGDGGGGRGGLGQAPPPGKGSNPVQKRCVGKPPFTRQTEDPLAPPCVAYFKGDNFGSTWDGVTRDQINVIVWGNCGVDGSVQLVDVNDPAYADEHWAAYLHYFNDRFQTYGRNVRAWFTVHPANSTEASCADNSPTTRAAVQTVHDKAHPFFITPYYVDLSSEALSQEAARLHIMSQSLDPTREFTAANAPYVVSFGPDIEGTAAHLAGLVCSTFAGRQVTFGDATDTGKRRKFGIVYNEASDGANRGIDLIRSGIRDRCGDQAGDIVVGAAGRQATSDDMTQMEAQGVTTVLWLDAKVPLPNSGATYASPWRPEFVIVAEDIVGDNADRATGATLATSAGLMLDRRRGAFNEQPEKVALREACPDCTPNAGDIAKYSQLLLLFTGIQAAGPRLTPQSFDKGMRAIPPHNPGDPYVPTAYFGPGDHSFVKDYALAWWDSSGDAPSGPAPGCWRLVDGGRRYLVEDWASRQGGDAAIHQKVPTDPCQGEQ